MLRGEVAGLRARHESDVPVLQAELHDDVPTKVRADSRPWRPIPPGSPASPYAVAGPEDNVAVFSAIRLADEELAGDALLWGIDTHNRAAHLGISLRPAFRGHGLGIDIVRLLLRVRRPRAASAAGRNPGGQRLDDRRGHPGRLRPRRHAAPFILGRGRLRG
jgi:GNAT superfamily N-acetyltransferase